MKRLAAVEVRPTASHQHEFNAGKLREELGFGLRRVSAPLTLVYHVKDGEAPTVEESKYTLYDARERHATRTEWRLYYFSPLLPLLAREGDLLVIYRAEGTEELRAVVVRAGTSWERELERALGSGYGKTVEQFMFVTPEPPSRLVGERVIDAFVQPEVPGRAGFDVTAHRIFARSIRRNELPKTSEMAAAAQEIVAAEMGANLDSDSLLDRALAAETALYYAIENGVATKRLADLYTDGRPDLTTVLDFAMSIHQGRRSRRGSSLESHFAVLLRREQIPFNDARTGMKCKTEGGERPDFIMPGCREYGDQSFPAERLRMVACKSTERERWKQIMREGRRIPEKYLLTLDQDLTDSTIREMRAAGLRPFLPLRVLEEVYKGRPTRQLLGSVAELLDELQSVG